MPTVKVMQKSSLPAMECFERISKMLTNDPELRKLDRNYSCSFDAHSMSGTATGSQFKANLRVTGHSSESDVEITVDLPFHLALAKGLVQKTLAKKLAEILS